jgi:hypothetical protein
VAAPNHVGLCCLLALTQLPRRTPSSSPTPGLTDALLTGGIPPAATEKCPADRTYRALFRRVLTQNARYYAR